MITLTVIYVLAKLAKMIDIGELIDMPESGVWGVQLPTLNISNKRSKIRKFHEVKYSCLNMA